MVWHGDKTRCHAMKGQKVMGDEKGKSAIRLKMEKMNLGKSKEELEEIEKERKRQEEIAKEVTAFDIQYGEAKRKKAEKEILKNKQIPLSALPTHISHNTIFFPLPRKNRKELQDKPVKIVFEIGNGETWATVKYYGIKLSIDDQDILLAIIHIIREKGSPEIVVSFTDIQKAMNIKPNSYHNKRIDESLQRLSIASFIIEYSGDFLWESPRILKATRNKRRLRITIEPEFYNQIKNYYTEFPLKFYQTLKGDLTKLLYIFLMSHKTPISYSSKLLFKALNMNTYREKWRLINELKNAFKELVARGFLKEFVYDGKRDVFELRAIPRKDRKRIE